MLSYQDFTAAPDKPSFILEAITQHKQTHEYNRAITAQSYYSTDNEQIMKKMTYLQRQFPGLRDIKFHKITDSFYRNGVDEHISFLMGNGLTIDKKGKFTEDVKRMIDREIDEKLKRAGKYAFIDGVSWAYPRINGGTNASKKQGELFIFRQNEFVPIYDELTGRLMLGIRFTQIAKDKPLIIELFELDGLTTYVKKDNGAMEIAQPKTAYRTTITSFKMKGEIRIDGTENYPILPVFPLYANDERTTTLTTSIQSLIDVRDFLMSAQGDSQTLVEGIYWILQNYGGQDDSEIIKFIVESKAIRQFDDAHAGAASHVLESPFQGKEAMLDRTNSLLYSAFCLPDPTVSGGITAYEINTRNNPMDRFASMFEPNVRTFMNNIMRLYGIDADMLDFKRQVSTNETEAVGNIVRLKDSEIIDTEEAIFMLGLIPEDRKEALLERIKLRDAELDDMKFPADEETSVTGAEASQEAERVAGKTLTGIQTTSLIGVIEKYAAGALTLQQAVNIVSVSIGVTAEEARRIIEGLE